MSLLGNHPTLEAHLVTMLQAMSTTMTNDYSQRPLSLDELEVSARNLLKYLAYTVVKKRRHTRTVMVPGDLRFYVFKTNKPEEATVNDQGVKTKGPNRWYYLVLSETVGGVGNGGQVEILVQGDTTLEKGKVMEEFRGMVEMAVADWDEKLEEKERLRRATALAAAGGA